MLMDVDSPPPAASTPTDRLLAAMASLPDLTSVSTKPINDGKKANDHGVR